MTVSFQPKMEKKIQHMNDAKKAPYQAPSMGKLDLLLERGILTVSEIPEEENITLESVTWDV